MLSPFHFEPDPTVVTGVAAGALAGLLLGLLWLLVAGWWDNRRR